MENNANDTPPDSPPLWQYIPVAEYRVPPATIAHTIRGGIRGHWKKLFSSQEDTTQPVQEENALQSLSDAFLDRVVPEPKWQDAVEALTATVSTESGLKQPVTLVIGPPHSHNADILVDLAERQWGLV